MARTRRLPLIALVCLALTAAACSLPFGGSERSGQRAPDTVERGIRWSDCSDIPRALAGRVPKGLTYQCATIDVLRDWTATGSPAAGSGGPATAKPGGGLPRAATGGTEGTGADPKSGGGATGATGRAAGPDGGTTGSTGGATGPGGGAAGSAGGRATLQLALVRIRSAHQSGRIGSLLINPGGPGGSGIEAAVYLSFGPEYGGIPDEITRRFDLVGFDPRGVGRSSPVDCVSDADFDALFSADPDPVSQADFDALVTANGRVAAGCVKKYGDTLTSFSTEQAARDMDAVRAAVGDEKTTYLGYSYGTLLGATYAQLFPQRVRAFVLDGAVDPKADAVTASEGQARGFEKAFGNFTAWCRRTPKDCPVAPDAGATLITVLDKARVSPARGEDGREATAGWIYWAVVASLYTKSGWEELAKALDKLVDGNPEGIFELADRYVERDSTGGYGTMFDAFFAINCADDPSQISARRARALQSQWRARYPFFGGPLATQLLTCSAWPGKRDPYPTGPAKGAPPIVVVGTLGDPATPYEQTAKLADMLGVGRVLTYEGEGHTAYPETDCVTKAVDSYLVDLKVPAPGLRCPAG